VSRRFLLGFLGLVVVVLAALEIPLGVQNARTERSVLETRVERDATTLASLAQEALRRGDNAALRRLADVAYGYRQDTGGRVVVVDRRAVAVVDTSPRGPGAESFASRPEFRAALGGRIVAGTRDSSTLGTDLLYVAVPVGAAGQRGAVRITYPTSTVDDRIRRYWLVLAAIAALALLVAAIVGASIAAFVVRPLRRLEDAADAVGGGDLAARAPTDAGPPEVRSLARVFNDTVARLEALVRSREEFVADASHQLRTPLTALRLRLENLARDVAPSGQGELAGASAEVDRLASLVDGLLTLARADAGTSLPGRVDVRVLAQERIEAWSALSEERGFRLIGPGSGEPLMADVSADRLEQVVDNLLENAVEVSPPGGMVAVEVGVATPWVELRVRDEGPGMSPEDRRRAFDRFWRGRAGEGSGLGLAIVRRLVEADGGSVELVDAPSRGLEAVVRLRRDY
jgi:signal transduction histidine kinase